MGQVHADLVGPPGERFRRDQREPAFRSLEGFYQVEPRVRSGTGGMHSALQMDFRHGDLAEPDDRGVHFELPIRPSVHNRDIGFVDFPLLHGHGSHSSRGG